MVVESACSDGCIREGSAACKVSAVESGPVVGSNCVRITILVIPFYYGSFFYSGGWRECHVIDIYGGRITTAACRRLLVSAAGFGAGNKSDNYYTHDNCRNKMFKFHNKNLSFKNVVL